MFFKVNFWSGRGNRKFKLSIVIYLSHVKYYFHMQQTQNISKMFLVPFYPNASFVCFEGRWRDKVSLCNPYCPHIHGLPALALDMYNHIQCIPFYGGGYYAAQASHKFMNFLSLPPKCWDQRHLPPHVAHNSSGQPHLKGSSVTRVDSLTVVLTPWSSGHPGSPVLLALHESMNFVNQDYQPAE